MMRAGVVPLLLVTTALAGRLGDPGTSVSDGPTTDAPLSLLPDGSPVPAEFSITTCALRDGSLVAEVLGTTTCEGVETVGVLMGPFTGEGRFRHFPGATVAGGEA